MHECSKDVVILLTVYNRLSVKDTIESILNQTYKDFQLLIVDNASDDGTYELLEKYAQTDSRIVLVRNEKNMGQTYSLHRGMSLIKGKYIARIDADDLMMPTRLEKQVSFLENNSDYGVCGSWIQFITDDNRKGAVIRTCTTDDGLRVMQHIHCAFYHPAIMMRRSVLEEYKLAYDANYKMAEDYDMWRQILSYSKGSNIGEVLTLYRRGENNDSKNNIGITRNEANTIKRMIFETDDESKIKSRMLHALDIERRQRKSIIETAFVYNSYKQFVRKSLKKDNPDYKAVCKDIVFTIIGSCVQDNSALWAHIAEKVYDKLRKMVYRTYKKATEEEV